MFTLTLMQGPVEILIANVRIGLYGNMNSVIYRYISIVRYSFFKDIFKCLSMSLEY